MPTKFPIPQLFSGFDFDPVNAAIAAAVAVVTYSILHGLLAWFRKRLSRLGDERASRTWAEILQKTLAATSQVTVALTALLVGLTVLTLPAPWDDRVQHLWFLALSVQFGVYLHRAMAIGARHYFRSHARQPDEPVSVANTLLVWGGQSALWIVLALAMLSNMGINISTFIASLGIGGIALALAVQNILGDLFASLSIAIDKPFEVGDSISVTGFSGTVEHVGLKTTRVRSDSGEQIVIGNSELLKSTVRNFKRMSRRRVQFSLRINPQTASKLAAQIPAILQKIIEAQADVQFGRAHLKAIEQTALEFDIVYFVLDPSYSLFMDRQQAVLFAAMDALQKLGASMAPAPQEMLLRDSPANDNVELMRKPAVR